MGKNSYYGVVLDAGSSGTRIYIYMWNFSEGVTWHTSAANSPSYPELKLVRSKKIHPGVSAYANDVAAIGPDHLEALVVMAGREVPASKTAETPIFFLATGGVRSLPEQQQELLLQATCSYLKANTNFFISDCASHVQVISGETEGLLGWIATNYLLGGFEHPDEHVHGKGHHTYGFLDMGGASAQIAFAPNATEASKHANDLKMIRLRHLNGSSAEYLIFAATWLGHGANTARSRYIQTLQDSYGDSVIEIPDPCMPRGLRTTLSGEMVIGDESTDEQTLVGMGAFHECRRKTHPLLREGAPCADNSCLLDGQHAPAIDFDINHFIGVSEYWHIIHGVFGKGRTSYDLGVYQNAVTDFCDRDWFHIENELGDVRDTRDQKLKAAREACFKASWLISMLHDGIGIPRVTTDDTSDAAANITKAGAAKLSEDDIRVPFQPVKKIGGTEVTWTLGKMLLYATGQIPSESQSSIPVGFGSNVDYGTPMDFEYAGSTPLLPSMSNTDDNADRLTTLGKSAIGIFALSILLLLAVFSLRRPDWRRRLLGIIQCQCRSCSTRKASQGRSSLVRKLLGRQHSAGYERISTEGEAVEIELGEVDLDDHGYSDSSDNFRASRHPSITALKGSFDRVENIHPPPEMDRTGLAVRTESRERLAPTLQMLKAGRRSRGGSPTRLKSPLATTLQE
ncbi:hypothetical protein CDD83_3971 [Cordyceps sp. RAO-2017]|nr:hypothetical protein CDD83_3971 [Cordyceps sp. RAO-2017]